MVIRCCLCLLFGYGALLAEQPAPRATAAAAIPLQQALKRAMPFPFPAQAGEAARSPWAPTIGLPPLPAPAWLASGSVTSCAIPLTHVPAPTDRSFSMKKIPSQGKTLDRMTKQPPVQACEEIASSKTAR